MYILMIIVTEDQEAAIENLFQDKQWKYDKIDTVALPRVEPLCLDPDKGDDRTPSVIHQSFLQIFLEHLSKFSLRTVGTIEIQDKVNDKPNTYSLPQCDSRTGSCISDHSNKEYDQACQNESVQLLKSLPVSSDLNLFGVCKDTSQHLDTVMNTHLVTYYRSSQGSIEKHDPTKPNDSDLYVTTKAAKSDEDIYKENQIVAENQSLYVSHKQTIETEACDDTIENKSEEVIVDGNVVCIDETVESNKDDKGCSVSYIAGKEKTESNDGSKILTMTDDSLGDWLNVNGDRLHKFDDKLLNDLEIICKILKNAIHTEFDHKLMLPKLKEILTCGYYLWKKYVQMEGMETEDREKEYAVDFIDDELVGSTDVEKDLVDDLDGTEVKVEMDIINDLEKEREVGQNDKDVIDVIKPATNITELVNDFIGYSDKLTKNTKKATKNNRRACQVERSGDNGKWIKCEILNCNGVINNTFEETARVTFQTARNGNKVNGRDSSKLCVSKERGKWKCNKQALLSVEREKLKAKTKQETSVKYRWTVNRNMRMHRSHRKCSTVPPDLDSSNFSALENGYYCPDCQFIFNGKSKFTLHKKLKDGNCLQNCIYCDADEQKDVYRCSKCPKCFQTKEMLERHKEKHGNQRSCNFCDAKFYTVNDLKVHVQTVHSETTLTSYLCDLCGSKFKERKVLNAHRRFVHSDERPEACGSCDKRFKTKSQLKNHLVTHKQASELNLSCEICGKMFLRVATLKDHVRRHKKEFSLFCTICNKGFYRKYSLEEHMRVHTGDKPFDCKFCGFKCALSCNLIKHMKIHSQYKVP